MRTSVFVFSLFSFVVLAGCTNSPEGKLDWLAGTEEDAGAAAANGEGSDAPPSHEGQKVDIGQVQQRAQFASGTVVNEAGLNSQGMWLNFSASDTAQSLNVYYVTARTTDSGSVPGTVTLAGTVNVPANLTVRFPVNMADAAFSGGYGSLMVLSTTGSGPQDVFQTYVMSGNDIWSVGGSVFNGGSFRIPYWAGTTKIALAVTNTSDFTTTVNFDSLATPLQHKAVNLPSGSTYLFDSAASGWGTLPYVASINVTTTAGGTVVVSGYEQRGTSTMYRVVPVKAAPYFCQ